MQSGGDFVKKVVITGSTRGIGRGLAVEFLKRDCRVVVSGKNQERLKLTEADFIRDFGEENVEAVLCDVTDLSQVHNLWEKAVERLSPVIRFVKSYYRGAGRRHPDKPAGGRYGGGVGPG